MHQPGRFFFRVTLWRTNCNVNHHRSQKVNYWKKRKSPWTCSWSYACNDDYYTLHLYPCCYPIIFGVTNFNSNLGLLFCSSCHVNMVRPCTMGLLNLFFFNCWITPISMLKNIKRCCELNRVEFIQHVEKKN